MITPYNTKNVTPISDTPLQKWMITIRNHSIPPVTSSNPRGYRSPTLPAQVLRSYCQAAGVPSLATTVDQGCPGGGWALVF